MGSHVTKASRAGLPMILMATLLAPLASAQSENRFDRALRAHDRAWKTLGDDLVRQYNAVRTLRKDTARIKAMSYADRQNLDRWESEINRQLKLLSEGRRVRTSYRERYGPKAELIAAQGYTDLLRMDAETYSRSRDSYLRDVRERARNVITENMINVAEAGARTLYDLVTKRLTLTADWYELITKQNAETGKVGSRSQAAFNLFTAYLIVAGLKAAPAVAADKNIVGEKLTDLIPRRTPTGSTPTPAGTGGSPPSGTGTGARDTTPPPTATSGADTRILPPPDLPGSGVTAPPTPARTGPGDTQVLPPSELPGGGARGTGPNDTQFLPPPDLPASAPREPTLRRLPPEEQFTDSSSFPALAQRELPELAAEARRVGVPAERIRELVRTSERTGNMAEKAAAELELTREILRRTGWNVDLPRAEKLALTQAYLHSKRGGLTSADLRFLEQRLSQDSNYFDNLRRRGNVDSEGNFVPGLGPREARELRDAYLRRTRRITGGSPPRGIPRGVSPPRTDDDANVPPPGGASGGARSNPATGTGVPRIHPPAVPELSSSSSSSAASGAGAGAGVPPNVRPVTGGSGPSGGNISVGEPYEETTEVVPPIEFTLYPLSRAGEPTGTVTDLVNEDFLDLQHLGARDGERDRDDTDDDFQLMMIDSATDDSDGVIVLAGARPFPPRLPRLARELWGAVRRAPFGPRPMPVAAALLPASFGGSYGSALRTVSSSQPRPSEPGVKVFFQSLGVSTGEAFQAHFLNEGTEPVRIRGEGIVVEPVKERAQKRLAKELEGALGRLSGDKHVTAKLSAYCLEFARKPPNPGMMFRIADEEVQRRFAPMRRILQASRKLFDLGLLHPDSDATNYFHSIRQWALWTRENGFDQRSFEKAFVDRTRKNFAASGQGWSKDVEKLVRELVPNRWGDIQTVLEESALLLDSAR